MKEKTGKGKSSLTKRSLQKFMNNRMAVVGLAVVVLMILACIFAPLITKYNPSLIAPANRELPISREHILGTDRVGRDIFARILYGGRMSILIGVASAVGSTVLGAVIGCISGFYGKWVDKVLVTVQEFFSIFPSMIIIMLLIAFTGKKNVMALILVFIFTNWSGMMRIVRGRILSLKQEPFIESCRVNGVSGFSIMFHHLIPNTLGPIIVNMTLSVAGFILSEAGLSFIGMGVAENVPTWGNIINAAKRIDIIQNLPALWLGPGVAIALFVLGINYVGDGLRDALDPSSR